MINWSMNKLKFTSGIGCLCMAGLLGEVCGKHLPFWAVMLVTMPPLVLFLFFQSDDFPIRWVKRFQMLGAIWYFTVAIGLTVLSFQQGHLTTGWPIFLVGLILGGIPCGIVLWRTYVCPPAPPPLDYSEPRDIFRLLGLPPPQADTHGAILILEDDRCRMERFSVVLQSVAPNVPVIWWRNGRKMIAEVDAYLAYAHLISLDHDLYPQPGDTDDPGDGLEVAKHLAEKKPTCPIIIHSSNGDRASMMAGEFELAGCYAKMVAPLGADWIEAYWAKVVEKLLGQKDREPQV